MLGHDFIEMPTKSTDVGDNPRETVMLLRCGFCMRTPTKAREDGCPIRELEEAGRILLSDFNPDGVSHFEGRLCVTCDGPIMEHELRRGYDLYFCHPNQTMFSDGISGCTWDVEGVGVPDEPAMKDLPQNN